MSQFPAVPEVEATQAAALAETGRILLLDVREDDEWQAGRAPSAEHVPLSALDPDVVPRDRPIVAVCRSGNRSGKAAQVLIAAGYDVHNLAGGMKAWAAAGLPVVRNDGVPGEVT